MAQFLIVLLALLLSSTAASAQAPTRIASGYSAISGPHAVLWMAREAGLFEKNGLRAEVAYIRSGTTMSQALLARSPRRAGRRRCRPRWAARISSSSPSR